LPIFKTLSSVPPCSLNQPARLNHHSYGAVACFNLIVSGISLRSTPDTILIVMQENIHPQMSKRCKGDAKRVSKIGKGLAFDRD